MASSSGYLDLRLEDFLEEVASADLAPGGGYVVAVAVAMAAGLVAMAARHSRGHWPEAEGTAAQAETLRRRVTPLAEQNVEAYLGAVQTLRGKDGVEPGSRDAEIADALDRAADIPLRIARAASDVSALAALVAERGQPGVRADAATAAVLSQAAARAAAALVEVNLTTTKADERVVQARQVVAAAEKTAEQALAALG